MVAGPHLHPVRRVVDPARPFRPPLEVLHRVREVQVALVEARLRDELAQQSPCRAHERPAGAILDVAGLFPDEHRSRSRRPFSEHDASRVAP